MHKGLYAQWEKQGQKTMEQLAAEKVDQILEAHTVAPLVKDIQENISDIVARELEWIGSKAGD
jgi:trimethylamine:corrinoid methyltransferase-like protein